MASTRKRLFLFAAALLPLVTVCLLLTCPRRPQVGPDWTPQRLRDELERAGLVYDARDIPRGDPTQEFGCYLKRPGDPRPWQELADPERAVRPERWRGYVRLTPALPDTDTTEGPNRCRVGPLLVVGDPAEIRRIVEALR
jgi:hypothetical protein